MIPSFLYIEIYPGPSIMLEAFLIGVVMALLGASGYVFLVYSIREDRKKQIYKKMKNPWDQLSKEENPAPPKNEFPKKLIRIFLFLALIALMLLLITVAVQRGWI